MVRKGKIIIIAGPSGSGKTTLHQRLLLSGRFKRKLIKSISATTRVRRRGERDGRDYLFLSRAQFLQRIKSGFFLEWKKVFNDFYGTPKKAAEKLLKAGKNVLLCIDVQGAREVTRQYPEAVKIFIKAPSMAEVKRRLIARGSETKKDLARRLAVARRELREAKRYDYVLVNDNLTECAKKLKAIVSSQI